MYGSYKFYQECVKNNLSPIIGIEIEYMDEDSLISKLLAYAMNEEGYKNLLKISSFLAINEKPFGLDFLSSYKSGLSYIMVFNESILERYLYSKATNELKNKLISLNQSFSFYVGYSYTNRLDRLNENQSICKIALELGVKDRKSTRLNSSH